MAALPTVPAANPPAEPDAPSSTPLSSDEALGSSLVEDWRTFHGGLRRAAMEASESGTPLCVLMLDLLRIAKATDRLAGKSDDHDLAELADTLRAGCPAQSIATRYASVRFVVVLPGSSLADAAATGEQLCAVLTDGDGSTAVPPAEPLHGTIGVAQYRDGEPLCHLLQRAADELDFDRLR